METPVTGGSTPLSLSLGELRQAILAVVVGSPYFTEEEQLLTNHTTYECLDEATQAKWLRNVRRQDVQRRRNAHLLALQLNPLPQAVCDSEQAQYAELEQLLECRALTLQQKSAAAWLIGDPIYSPTMRLRLLGDAYFALLRNVGYQEVPNRYPGLLSN